MTTWMGPVTLTLNQNIFRAEEPYKTMASFGRLQGTLGQKSEEKRREQRKQDSKCKLFFHNQCLILNSQKRPGQVCKPIYPLNSASLSSHNFSTWFSITLYLPLCNQDYPFNFHIHHLSFLPISISFIICSFSFLSKLPSLWKPEMCPWCSLSHSQCVFFVLWSFSHKHSGSNVEGTESCVSMELWKRKWSQSLG